MHYDLYLSLGVYKRELLVNDSCALIPGTGIKLIRSENNLWLVLLLQICTSDEFPFTSISSLGYVYEKTISSTHLRSP